MKTVAVSILIISALCFRESLEEQLDISPAHKVTGQLNGRVTFRCDQPQGRPVEFFNWFVNGVNVYEIDDAIYQFYSVGESASVLNIINLLESVHNSVIHCEGHLLNETQSSPQVLLVIQGLSPEIEEVEVHLDDFTLYMNWSRPFTRDRIASVCYKIEVTNHTSNENMTIWTFNEEFSLSTNSSHRIACDSYTISITPNNTDGDGVKRIVPINYAAPILSGYELISQNKNKKMDLIIILNNPVCQIKDANLSNIYTKDSTGILDYDLIEGTYNYYRYFITLDVYERNLYNLHMILSNPNGSSAIAINISTFAVHRVSIVELSTGINVEVSKSSLATEDRGVFVILLNCKTNSCEAIDFTNSIYLLTFSGKNDTYSMELNRGVYLLLVYETAVNGSLLTSYNNTCLPFMEEMISLHSTSLHSNSSADESSRCDISYSNNTVSSLCN